MGRPSAARERILETAAQLFYEHGFRAVGVDRIIAESGVAKATLYAHFPSKDDLVLSYVQRADVRWTAHLRRAAEAAGPDPRAQMIGAFDALREIAEAATFRGCAFINTASEAIPGTPVHEATVRHKQAVRAWLRELAAAAGAADPDLLALQLTLLIDGGLAAGAVEPSPEVGLAAQQAARVVIAASCG
ncbi:TetR/AcrR family transcriptional regulator [Kutzneria viridogrisea]|uniref:HTH tetR-type domain-containing protein n=2 Tax=Kutzneria TaxID=43356 RepID=W5WRD1_9PSEU|nr:TetR/AcrR family transcriptional regulator [Kutzneria albida]AHI00720.1 hypothetical protein KALB_7362 [Kutzneria albida DSM 43870]MBA8925993.1 AcrR family transcriptional regulator [Kutzneria viridogrisea]